MAMASSSMAPLSFAHSSSRPSFLSSLATFRSTSSLLPTVRNAAEALRQPLQIEARETTRRESVKLRHLRIRKKINGTTERPRLAVFRSNKHIYVQVIDDTKMHTIVASSTLSKPIRGEVEISSGPTIEAAKKVGEEIAKACLEKGIKQVAFDRGGFVYHGRIQALADAARENGLEF
ncbi:hypothetical protein O6H91_11G017500 [Diphasiastrum complanatum]|uniref:Uncharacterized protein n=1 Tax=Diphasiastrum complanatum TaxID=34168 RepID=A0ACC2C6R0_DIPCM|nr:hypothetical protein O6H91_Y466300 [Diphasiastrum complanatum]KAJ7537694.1 hypothetical protein O6H91_11G017500 [Diphasiastrum complanatum]